jgi:STE24 endopeptidase
MNDFLSSTRTFDLKSKVAALIKQYDYPMVLNVVLHRLNIDHVEEILDMADRMGAITWSSPTRSSTAGPGTTASSCCRAARRWSGPKPHARRFRERVGRPMRIFFVVPDYFERRPKACMNGLGSIFLTVTPDGTALPCHAARMLPGLDVSERASASIGTIWYDSRASTISRRRVDEGALPQLSGEGPRLRRLPLPGVPADRRCGECRSGVRSVAAPSPGGGGGRPLVLAVFLLLQLLGLPFALWRTFSIEARHGFNRTSPRLFAADFAKGLVLSLAIGAPLLLALLLLMERAGGWWWVWAWCIWMVASLGITWAAPRFIAPLFNRFSPVTDEKLRARAQALLQRCGYSAAGGLYVMDGSRRSAHGNAYFTGLGRNKRIVLLDTLLERIEIGEIEAVLAHELGHFRLHHVRQRLVLASLAALGGFWLLAMLAGQPAVYAALGVPQPSAAMALILFALCMPVLAFFARPLGSWLARRQEFAADEFAAKHADARELIGALVKLYRDNAATLTPDPVHSAFYDSHPPAPQRIARLNELLRPGGGANH